MKKFEISLIFISVLICYSTSLPVKESKPSSTEKDPNDHHGKDEDSPTHNLENIIGEINKNFSHFHH